LQCETPDDVLEKCRQLTRETAPEIMALIE